MPYPRLRFSNNEGWLVASDAVLICFYMQHPHRRLAPAIMRALDTLRARIKPHQLGWYTDPDGYMHPLDDSRWEMLRQEILGSQEGAVPRLDGSQRTGGFYVDYRGLPLPLSWPGREHAVSTLYITLPTEFIEERGPESVRALALELAEELPFNSGYVDLAVCRADLLNKKNIESVSTDHPGVYLASDGPDIHMGTHVDGVHWMNFLGQPVLGQLGGVAKLREQLALPRLSIESMSGDRVVLTLGAQPESGSAQMGQSLPLHRELARLLEPHLHHRNRPFGNMGTEAFLRWERRFLDG